MEQLIVHVTIGYGQPMKMENREEKKRSSDRNSIDFNFDK